MCFELHAATYIIGAWVHAGERGGRAGRSRAATLPGVAFHVFVTPPF
jgi:hypothetical protein